MAQYNWVGESRRLKTRETFWKCVGLGMTPVYTSVFDDFTEDWLGFVKHGDGQEDRALAKIQAYDKATDCELAVGVEIEDHEYRKDGKLLFQECYVAIYSQT